MMNMSAERITPYLLCSFLEASAFSLWKAYGDQFAKLLKSILQQLVPMIPSQSVAARTRLELFLVDSLTQLARTGSFPEPEGRVPI